MASDARVLGFGSIGQERTRQHELLRATVAGGVLAGAAMLAWAALTAAFLGLPAARPLELAGSTFFGAEALEGGPAVLLAGALVWVVVSIGLALPFAAAVPRDFPFAQGAVMGVGYSFVVLAVMSTVVLPRLAPVMRAEMPEMGGAWVLAYVVFGIALGLVPPLRRRLAAP